MVRYSRATILLIIGVSIFHALQAQNPIITTQYTADPTARVFNGKVYLYPSRDIQDKVPWVKPDCYSMWAPDCVFANGKYYFYFPSTPRDSTYGKGFAIGVAIADKPEGPFLFERKGVYYLTYPDVRNKIECLEYATSNNPMGQFKKLFLP